MHLERLKNFMRECRSLISGQGYQAGGGSMLVFREDLQVWGACGTSV